METGLLSTEAVESVLTLFGTVFLSGFGITIALHYCAYGIFKALSLLNIKK